MTNSTVREVPVGAYPIKDHRSCAEITRKNVSYPEELKVGPTDALQGRFDDGNRFEAATTAEMLETFSDEGWRVITVVCGRRARGSSALSPSEALEVLSSRSLRRRHNVVSIEIPNRDSKAAKRNAERVTAAAMGAGVDVIFGGRIVAGGRVGEPDLLVGANTENRRKHHFRYHGVDIKDHKSFSGTARSREWMASTLDAPFADFATVYEAVGTPQLVDSMQLVHYWYLLAAVGRATPDRVGGIVGREGVVVWRDLDANLYERRSASAFDVYDEAYESYRRDVAHERARLDDVSLEPAAGPEWKTQCSECVWREVCYAELREANHITLLPGVTPTRAGAHYDARVTRIGELARMDTVTARLIDAGVDTRWLLDTARSAPADAAVETLYPIETASLLFDEGLVTAGDVAASIDARTSQYVGTGVKNLAQAVDQARVAMVERVHRARGVDRVSITRTAIELDVDIEDDGKGMCYLIGVRESRRTPEGSTSVYIPFVTWDSSPEAEAENFARFWAYMQAKLDWASRTRAGAVRAYYYTQHETRFFKALAARHAGTPGVPTVEEVTAFTDSQVWVDMYPILSTELVWPTENHGLKSLAKYARFMWRDETPGGANSVAWYRQQIDEPDTEVRDELRQRLLDYNEDDVSATWELREFISRMGEARRPGLKLPSVANLDLTWGPRRPGRRRAALAVV